jgi:Spy/CpxP family protein refolding chaperone
MKIVRTLVVLVVALLLAVPGLAAEKKAKSKTPPCPAAQRVERIVHGLTLTAEQTAKLDELKKEYGPKLADAIKKSEVMTPEMKKARDEAAKTAKAAGKKGKELNAAIDAAGTLTADQKAQASQAKKQISALEKELREKVVAQLTAEQKEKINKKPEPKKGDGKKVEKKANK